MITQEELKEHLHYDPLTGDFNWIIGKRGLKVNSKAGSMNDQGYVIIRINNIRYRAHRLAWLCVYGHFPINEIDHINGVRSDNRIENLRDVTRKENKKNVGKYKTNTSGVNGVRWYEPLSKWHAQIQIDNHKIHLGYFENLKDAIAARKSAETNFNFHINHGRKNSHESQT